MNLNRRSHQVTAILAAATVPLLLAAGCKSSPGSAQTQPPAASTSATPASSPSPVTTSGSAPTSCSVVTQAERESRKAKRDFDLAYAHAYKKAGDVPAHARKYEADILTMGHREAADNAEIAFRHAERTAKALEKELLAWQSIGASIRAMFPAVRA